MLEKEESPIVINKIDTLDIKKISKFGDYLKHSRYNSRKTPKQICRDLRIDLEDYENYESGKKIPEVQVARRLATYLKMDKNKVSQYIGERL